MDERTARIYCQLKPYKALVNKTRGFIRWALARVSAPYVACSFGKDSSVMLHLVLQEKPDVEIKFLAKKETPLIDNYAGVVAWWEQNYHCQVQWIEYLGWLEDANAPKGIAANVPDATNDSFFVGLRMDESVARRISLKTHGLFFPMKSGKIRIAPMCDWKVDDIAAYMYEHKLPILAAYQREGFTARTTSNIPSKFPHESIARLKDANMDAYNRLLRDFPTAKYFT